MTSLTWIEFLGWIPAVVFPLATVVQFVALIRAKTADGVSRTTWALFGVANVAMYLFAEKYLALQAIFAFLGTAALDFAIVAYATWLKRQRSQQSPNAR